MWYVHKGIAPKLRSAILRNLLTVPNGTAAPVAVSDAIGAGIRCHTRIRGGRAVNTAVQIRDRFNLQLP